MFKYIIILVALLFSCSEVKVEKPKLTEKNREEYCYKCVHKTNINGDIITMSEYDKFIIIKNCFPNCKVLAIDGYNGIRNRYSLGTTFIIISQDTLIKDNNTIIKTDIRIIRDDCKCDCHNTAKSRKFKIHNTYSYDE